MRIAFLGLGIMGSRMAANLLAAGHELSVWNRTTSTADAWAAEHPGARVASSPADAARDAELVITMVVDGPQVRSVLLGGGGAVHGAPAEALFADMSTIAPDDALAIAARLRERGHGFLDAPVTGSSPGAEAGTLTIMVGGVAEDVARAMPAFEAMGRLVRHVGRQGDGQRVKLINNATAIANTIVAGQALLAGRALGVDLDALVEILSSGAGGSTVLTVKQGSMRRHDYTTFFKAEHMLKDVGLCLDAAATAGLTYPAAEEARILLEETVASGPAGQDYTAVLEILEDRAGVRL